MLVLSFQALGVVPYFGRSGVPDQFSSRPPRDSAVVSLTATVVRVGLGWLQGTCLGTHKGPPRGVRGGPDDAGVLLESYPPTEVIALISGGIFASGIQIGFRPSGATYAPFLMPCTK